LLDSLSKKLAKAASTHNGKVKEKEIATMQEKASAKTSKKTELTNQHQIKKEVTKNRSSEKITPVKEPKFPEEKAKPKEQASQKQSKKEAKTPDKSNTRNDKSAVSDKHSRFLKYQQWQNRAGPPAPGSKEVPKVRKCKIIKIFVLTLTCD